MPLKTSLLSLVYSALIAAVSITVMYTTALAADGQPTLQPIWVHETHADLTGYGNDNTGVQLELKTGISLDGKASIEVKPDGKSLESKVAFELSGESLIRWINSNGDVFVNVYIPQEMSVTPGMFFLGLADVTDKWSWVGGDFSKSQVKPGWNSVRYPICNVMTYLEPSRKYMVYLAFAGMDGTKKVPLSESFYIDGIYKENDPNMQSQSRSISPEKIKEVEKLLNLTDDKLLDTLTKKTFDYFWYEANPGNGLIKDRSTKDSFASIAAVGFGLSAIPIGVERGWITKNQGSKRVLNTLKTFVNGEVEGYKGFFYHFIDMATGRRYADVELSSIDTALLVAGALTAGQYFKGDAEVLARTLYENVDWQWMMNGGDTLTMGWKPESGFLEARWNEFCESMIMYILAIGSPTHPISPDSWKAFSRPVVNGHVGHPDEVLFMYQYSHAWIDFKGKIDGLGIDYWESSVAATKYNRDFCIANASTVPGYSENIWGLSASDGPGGYRAYGAAPGNHDGTIAPYASVASMPFIPELSYTALKGMLKEYGPHIWGKYGLVSAFNPRFNWYSDEHIGIDQGDIILMVENHRSGLIWRLFMGLPDIARAMDLVGFKTR